jgi:hypothetical protein
VPEIRSAATLVSAIGALLASRGHSPMIAPNMVTVRIGGVLHRIQVAAERPEPARAIRDAGDEGGYDRELWEAIERF